MFDDEHLHTWSSMGIDRVVGCAAVIDVFVPFTTVTIGGCATELPA